MTFRRVCSWCDAVLEEGSPGAETSHGICESCAALESRKLVVSPLVVLDSRRVEDGGASLRVSSAVSPPKAPLEPSPGVAALALERARAAWERTSPQLFMEV